MGKDSSVRLRAAETSNAEQSGVRGIAA
jgi:hypothetical protein